jgi:putative FmdB family regulatory protein
MPQYEFLCLDCHRRFSRILTLVDCEEDEVLCPHCGSLKVEQRWSALDALTHQKSA